MRRAEPANGGSLTATAVSAGARLRAKIAAGAGGNQELRIVNRLRRSRAEPANGGSSAPVISGWTRWRGRYGSAGAGGSQELRIKNSWSTSRAAEANGGSSTLTAVSAGASWRGACG